MTDLSIREPAEPGCDGPPISRRPGMGLVGVGAFGAFAVPHLARYFDLRLYDRRRDLGALVLPRGARRVTLAEAAAQAIVVLAVPLASLRGVAEEIAPILRPGALVVDVSSLKVKPLAILEETLPAHVDIVGTHPLFGPQSASAGIGGLRIAVCAGRGKRAAPVARFLSRALGLDVIATTPERHDRQMAYVQGLTHLLGRVLVAMDIPPVDLATPTFEHMMRMVSSVRHDTDELYRTITAENPFAAEMKARFLEAASGLAGHDGEGLCGRRDLTYSGEKGR